MFFVLGDWSMNKAYYKRNKFSTSDAPTTDSQKQQEMHTYTKQNRGTSTLNQPCKTSYSDCVMALSLMASS